jgi:hypothetical protein
MGGGHHRWRGGGGGRGGASWGHLRRVRCKPCTGAAAPGSTLTLVLALTLTQIGWLQALDQADYDLCASCHAALPAAEQPRYRQVAPPPPEQASAFLCEEAGSCYEKSMIRAIAGMLEGRGDVVTQVFQLCLIDLSRFLTSNLES